MIRLVHVEHQIHLIRTDLAEAFPATIFQITIDRAGYTPVLDISWTDGPTYDDVWTVIDPYNGEPDHPGEDDRTQNDAIACVGYLSLLRYPSRAFFERQMRRVCGEHGITPGPVQWVNGLPFVDWAAQIDLGSTFLWAAIYDKVGRTRAGDCVLGRMPNRPPIEAVRET